jgi:hypothetical protein
MVSFLLGVIVGLYFGIGIGVIGERVNLAQKPKVPPPFDPAAKGNAIREFFGFKKTEYPGPPPKPMGTIPRTAGSWRRRRLELQKQHNTKQKERDALLGVHAHASTR